jgi:hypothetical protein
VETIVSRAWHFTHNFWRGRAVGFNTNNIPTTWKKRLDSLTKQKNCKTKFIQSIDGMEESSKIIPLSQEVGCLSTWSSWNNRVWTPFVNDFWKYCVGLCFQELITQCCCNHIFHQNHNTLIDIFLSYQLVNSILNKPQN